MLPKSLRAAAVGISTQFQNFNLGAAHMLPQRIAIVGQGSADATYSSEPLEVTTPTAVGKAYGFGSPVHLAAKAAFDAMKAPGAVVTIYALQQASEATHAQSIINITGATQAKNSAHSISVGGVESNEFVFTAESGPVDAFNAIVDAINGNIHMPVTAAIVEAGVALRAKHAGESGNSLTVQINGVSSGLEMTVQLMDGGTKDPDVVFAPTQWETIVINCLGDKGHDKLKEAGELKWAELDAQPFFAVSGSTANATTLKNYSASRTEDRINCVIPCPASPTAHWIIAGNAAGLIASQSNRDPALEFRGLTLGSVIAGDDLSQFDYATRDSLWKSGVSSVLKKSGSLKLENTVTFYHPEDTPDPEYGKVSYLVRLQNIIYNLSIIFNDPSWQQAPLIPDGQVSQNPNARKPSDAVAALNVLTNNLANAAILSNPDFTIDGTTASIDSENPNRVNITYPTKLSGNWDINSINLIFGFQLGGA